jgi:acyl-CoA dehydrogenase
MARLLVLKTCWKMDQVGAQASRDMIAASKTRATAWLRPSIMCWCRQADGPDGGRQLVLDRPDL